MSLSRAEVNLLRGLLTKMTVSPKGATNTRTNKRRRNRRPRAGQNNVPAGFTRAPNASGATTTRGGVDGEILVSRTELLCLIEHKGSVTSGKESLTPDSNTMPWLAKLVVAFDRIEWLSASLCWKPFVGTQTSGSIAFGVDWNSAVSDSITRGKVQSCTPVYETPVWQSGNLTLPRKMLMSRKFYSLGTGEPTDKQPGVLVWALAGTTASQLGEIWITYKVRLSGTTS